MRNGAVKFKKYVTTNATDKYKGKAESNQMLKHLDKLLKNKNCTLRKLLQYGSLYIQPPPLTPSTTN